MINLRGYTTSFFINSFSLASVCLVMITYSINKESMAVKLCDSTVTASMTLEQLQAVIISLLCSIFVTIPIAFELTLDVYLKWNNGVGDYRERLLMVAYVIFPSVFLLLVLYMDFDGGPYVIACVHVSQYIGCFGAILSLCNKLVPEYFTGKKICFTLFFYTFSNILLMLAYGLDDVTWKDYTMVICLLISLCTFFHAVASWIRSLDLKCRQSLKSLSVNQISCMLYLSTTILTIVIIPSVIGALYVCHILTFSLPVILIFPYSMILFTLIPSCIPGRIARYYSMLSESKVSAEREMKWAILRFISHELRSPLNVICTGATIALEHIELDASSRRENLFDISSAADLARGLLEDIMSFEMAEEDCDEFIQGVFRPISHIHDLLSNSLEAFSSKQSVTLSRIGTGLRDFRTGLGLLLDDGRIERVFRNIFTLLSSYSTTDSKLNVAMSYEPGQTIPSVDPYFSGKSRGGRSSSHQYPQVIPLRAERLGVQTSCQENSADTSYSNNYNSGKVAASLNAMVDNDAVATAGYLIVEFFCSFARAPSVNWTHVLAEDTSFLDASRLVGGSEFGLKWRLSQDIIRGHGGRLVVRSGSSDQSGLFVQVCLPCVRQQRRGHGESGPAIDPWERKKGNSVGFARVNLSYSSDKVCRESKREEGGGGGTKVEWDEENGYDNRLKDDDQHNLRRPSTTVGNNIVAERVECSDTVHFKSSAVGLTSVKSTIGDREVKLQGGINGVEEDIEARHARPGVDAIRDRRASAHPRRSCTDFSLRFRVLVVDDSELNRKVIRRAVERLSLEYKQRNVVFAIDDCADGGPACEQASRAMDERRPYDLVLMDNIMIHMHGPEAAARMRALGYKGYIAGVTGNVLAKDVKHFTDSGADCVLAKPLNLNKLKELVTRVIEQGRV